MMKPRVSYLSWLVLALLLIGLLIAAGSPAIATQPNPTPTTPPPPGGSCGDGVCDGPENAQNCPQDCAAGAPSGGAAVPATGVPDYEPPINVLLILHIDPQMDRETDTFRVTPEFYQKTHDEIDWLMEEAARHDMHFTSLYNGWYPKEALEMGDVAQFQELLDAGHEIGSHAHRLTYDPEQDLWTARPDELSSYGRPNYDAALARQAWDDADRYVDAVLDAIGAEGQNQTMCSLAFTCSDEGLLMQEFGFSVAAGSRAERSVSMFGHIVWNPWRPAANDEFGYELEEDPNAPYIVVDHLAQVGILGGAHGMELSTSQLQRRFLMLYVEWLSRERNGAEDRVWTFGFVYHPNYGSDFNEPLVEFLTWLDENFIGKTSLHGNVIAQYATIGDIAQQFEAWEAEYPGASSFSYALGDPYPYTYAVVPSMLEGAGYEAEIDLGEGVTCFRFSRDGQPVYLLWSDVGERTVDLSAELSGQVRVTSADGEQSVGNAAALYLTEEPLFVTP